MQVYLDHPAREEIGAPLICNLQASIIAEFLIETADKRLVVFG
jgi:hypothetical protein